MLVLLAELRGVSIVAASNLATAERLLEADGPFDMVVLDFNLGGCTAEPLVRSARRRGIRPIVVTGNPTSARAVLGSDVVVLTKPVSFDEILAGAERTSDPGSASQACS